MKVRVLLESSGTRYLIQVKKYFKWESVDIVYKNSSDDVLAANKAVEIAQRILNPDIIFEGEN